MTTTANRVMVTGATGFLGSHCLAPLVERGFDVLALYRERAPLDVSGRPVGTRRRHGPRGDACAAR